LSGNAQLGSNFERLVIFVVWGKRKTWQVKWHKIAILALIISTVQKPFRGKNCSGEEMLGCYYCILNVDDTFSFIVEVPIEQ